MKEEPYNSIPDLQWIYLEDSWVLAIEVTPRAVKFHLEAVLLEQHPLYEPPRAGEAYCYRKAVLSFGDVSKVEWSMHNARISLLLPIGRCPTVLPRLGSILEQERQAMSADLPLRL